MRYYIFITQEGATYQPNSMATIPDAENCQVLGFGQGDGISEAYANFTKNNIWLQETTFVRVMAYELMAEQLVGIYDIHERAKKFRN